MNPAPATRRNQPMFRIDLDNSMHQVYSAGDKVTGRVRFTSEKDHTIGRVVVKLWGRAETLLCRKDGRGNRFTYHGNAPLFSHEILLHDAKYKHKSPDLAWPFQFTFPEKPEPTSEGDKWQDNGGVFLDSQQHVQIDLPSSLSIAGTALGMFYGFDCQIKYQVEAYLFAPGSQHPAHDNRIRLPFAQYIAADSTPTLSPPIFEQNTFNVRSYKLAPGNEDLDLSFKQKAKMAFNSDDVPTTSFTVNTEAPSTFQMGQKHFVTLGLEQPNNKAEEVPEVSLKSFILEIIVSTSVRSRTATFSSGTNNSETKFRCDNLLRNSRERWSGPFTAAENFTKTLPLDGLYQMELVPSLKTANIARRYALKMVFLFECADKMYSMNHQSPISILPGRKTPETQSSQAMSRSIDASASSEAADSMFQEPVDQLPPYEEVPGYSTAQAAADAASVPEKSRVVEN